MDYFNTVNYFTNVLMDYFNTVNYFTNVLIGLL